MAGSAPSTARQGCRDSIAVIVAYVPFGLALGATLASTGLNPLLAWSTSPLIGGAAQLSAGVVSSGCRRRRTICRTIETWWPAIEVFLTTGLTNARTEGTNRLIKQVKRAACGFRNRENYRRRVRLHCTRRTR
jgi:hypothetical protein